MQLLGFDVDTIHTVQFSNHTGYPHGWTGERLDGTQLATLFQGLHQNDLVDPIDHVLTGYIGTASVVTTLATTVLPQLKRKRRSVRYVCDPVLGDKGVLYVPPALVDLYRDQVLPLADVITPNQYEAELLTQRQASLQTMEDVADICRALHALGPSLVLLTSVELPDRPGALTVVASERSATAPNDSTMWTVTCPLLPGHFTGTGDVCAALFLAHTANRKSDLPTALERVVNTIFAILEDTLRRAGETVQSRELCLIGAQRWILHPPSRFQAERVNIQRDDKPG